MKSIIISFFFVVFGVVSAQQNTPYWNDIQAFKTQASEKPLPHQAILMLGSSSFTNWQDVEDYFPGNQFINRGFGGSRLVDLIRYSKDLLDVPTPKQILIYCGENDIADTQDPADANVVLERFKSLFETLRKTYPEVTIDYISIKRSESREALWPEMKEANQKIKQFLGNQDNAHYIDVTKAMENSKGELRTNLFLEDKLHMNPTGYQVWTKVLRPYIR